MWSRLLLTGVLFYLVSYLGTKNHIHAGLLAIIFAVAHYILETRAIERFMPDSRNTTCAKGSVPAGNGLDCKLPTDIYGL
jgi:hypothetical protein